MPLTTAVANGPISYFTSAGQQLLIPVTAFGFDASGQLQLVDPALPYSEALSWLEHLHETGYIKQGEAPAPSLAMVISAADPGAWGNQIQVEITAGTTTFDLEVTATTSYTNVSLQTLIAELGTETQPGTRPGLVRFRNADLAAIELPAAATASLASGTDATPVPASAITSGQIKRASDSSTVAFELVARKPGSGGNDIDVTISDVSTEDETFSLQAVWHAEATGLDPSSPSILDTIHDAFGYVISVAAPPSDELGVPATRTFHLTGGTDASKASASPMKK